MITLVLELGHLSLKHFADEPFMRNFIVSSAEVFVLAQKQVSLI